MTAQLNLIKTENAEIEKRIFPRFPFSFMTFKDQNCQKKQVYEVLDISFTGMQLSLKAGSHFYAIDEIVSGHLHWRGQEVEVNGTVKWTNATSIGLAFSRDENQLRSITEFLSVENIINGMHPIHSSNMGLEMPSNLKYWLRADGPFEVFLWQHNDGELARFQVIMMNNMVEWEDGRGIKTGRVLRRRDIDSPLNSEDEFLLQLDDSASDHKVSLALELAQNIPDTYLPEAAIEFLCVKLGGRPL